jgi:Na+/proline symporter
MQITNGWVVFAVYAAIMVGVGVYVLSRYGNSLKEFLLAQRQAKWWVGAFSIAATWIWAPALFVSAQKAYQQGIVGWGWFFIPNVLCLIVFGLLAVKLRRAFDGTTLPEYMNTAYSPRVHTLYNVQFVVLQFCSFAVQLLAGAKILSMLTGFAYAPVVLVIAGVAVVYSLLGGFRASLITDFLQMLFILVVGLIGVIAVIRGAGWLSVGQGLGGLSGNFDQFFSREGMMVMLTFGIVNTIGLFAGPFGDQTFWQRVFAMKKENVVRAYTLGALIFAVVPIIFGLIGFAGAGLGIETNDPQTINVTVIGRFVGPGLMAFMLVLITAGLSSTMDSNLSAISSLAITDFPKLREKTGLSEIVFGRVSMAVLAVGASLIAFIPGLQIVHLFLFYGTLRATTLLPTVFTLWKGVAHEKYVYFGLLGSLAVGVPVFAIASLAGSWPWKLVGAGLAVGISGVATLLGQRAKRIA